MQRRVRLEIRLSVQTSRGAKAGGVEVSCRRLTFPHLPNLREEGIEFGHQVL